MKKLFERIRIKKISALSFLIIEKMAVYSNKREGEKVSLTRKIIEHLLTYQMSEKEKEYLRMKRLVAELDLDAKQKE